MRVFVAGASGVIGRHLVPLLIEDGHVVAGMTRSAGHAASLRALGAAPIVGDVFEADALRAALVACGPDVVVQLLTDLPDDRTCIAPPGGRCTGVSRNIGWAALSRARTWAFDRDPDTSGIRAPAPDAGAPGRLC